MLGSSDLVNKDQIRDCIDRGWIVLVPNHRLCPQLNLLEGPIQDCRDLLAWIHSGGLEKAIAGQTTTPYLVDLDRILAFGTSSGGTLALCLVRCVPRSTETFKNPKEFLFHNRLWKFRSDVTGPANFFRVSMSPNRWRRSTPCTVHATFPILTGRRPFPK